MGALGVRKHGQQALRAEAGDGGLAKAFESLSSLNSGFGVLANCAKSGALRKESVMSFAVTSPFLEPMSRSAPERMIDRD